MQPRSNESKTLGVRLSKLFQCVRMCENLKVFYVKGVHLFIIIPVLSMKKQRCRHVKSDVTQLPGSTTMTYILLWLDMFWGYDFKISSIGSLICNTVMWEVMEPVRAVFRQMPLEYWDIWNRLRYLSWDPWACHGMSCCKSHLGPWIITLWLPISWTEVFLPYMLPLSPSQDYEIRQHMCMWGRERLPEFVQCCLCFNVHKYECNKFIHLFWKITLPQMFLYNNEKQTI